MSDINGVEEVLRSLPSAQPERLTDDDFETIRIHLNAYKEKLGNQQRWKEAEEHQRIIDRFMAFASAHPDVPDTNAGDMICRQAALDALNEQIEQCNKALGSFDISLKDEFAIKVERASLEAYKEQLENLPPVQPTITHEQAIDYLHKTGWMQNHDRILTESRVPLKGTWKDFTDEGYVECPFCKSATNCGSKEEIDDLHFCFSCGAMLKRGQA